MYAFLMRHQDSHGNIQTSSGEEEMLSFDPSHVIQAITFHLLDEGKALAVSADSCAEVISELAERFDRLVISADEWAVMENYQRLVWLLRRSKVQVEFSQSGCATLSVA
jgi:hypothetical protein